MSSANSLSYLLDGKVSLVEPAEPIIIRNYCGLL
jgi:hypothetical protein